MGGYYLTCFYAPAHPHRHSRPPLSFPRRRESRLGAYAVISAKAEIYSAGFPPARE